MRSLQETPSPPARAHRICAATPDAHAGFARLCAPQTCCVLCRLALSPALQARLGPDLAARAADEDDLGGLRVHASLGLAADGVSYDELVTYGARSFSILRSFDTRGRLVFDSADGFERAVADLVAAGKLPAAAFNADNDGAEVDQRSDRAVRPTSLPLRVLRQAFTHCSGGSHCALRSGPGAGGD